MKNPIRDKIRQRKLCIGSWLQIGHTVTTEIMARAGYEWLAIDMEHAAIGVEHMQDMVAVIEAAGAVPLVRVAKNSATAIKQAMDAGAYGVIVPNVNTAEQARAAVAAVKYPPVGTRGVGFSRANQFGQGFDEYVATMNEQSLVVAQIEHIQAVENLDAICGTDGVDAVFIGPYDLSASLGIPGAFRGAEYREALDRFLKVGRETGTALGIHVVQPSPDEFRRCIDEGYTFIAYGIDTVFLGSGAKTPQATKSA